MFINTCIIPSMYVSPVVSLILSVFTLPLPVLYHQFILQSLKQITPQNLPSADAK